MFTDPFLSVHNIYLIVAMFLIPFGAIMSVYMIKQLPSEDRWALIGINRPGSKKTPK